ncbi:LamG domain-containing protein [Streptomyces sp. NPDC053728]|uniref:LamG domain-containing protein n=1 Tax=Streptomyces sp. NPDC053728 TaxID=3155534 RepID=UPI003420DA86
MDGSTGYAATDGQVLETRSSYTVSAWVRLTDGSRNRTVLSQDGAHRSPFYLGYEKNEGTWTFRAVDSDAPADGTWSYQRVAAKNPASPGVWTHIAGVYDAPAKELRFYVNGRLQGSAAYTTAWAADGPMQFGRTFWKDTYTDYVRGSVDEATAWQRALTGGEVADDAALATSDGFNGAELTAAWDPTSGSGTDDSAAQQRAAGQAAARKKALAEKRNKEAAEQRKQDGVLGNLFKGNFGAAWDNAKSDVAGAASATGQWVGDHWRDIADVAAFSLCFVPLGVCALAVAAVITAKAIADYSTHGLDTAGGNFAYNLQWGAIGLGVGAAVGGLWQLGVKSGRVVEYLPMGRHAKAPGRGRPLRRDPWVRGGEIGISGGAGLGSCAVPSYMNPGFC